MNEKNCKECLHFEACCKWTDFPKQCGVPVCSRFSDVAPKSEVDLYRKQVDELEDELASTYDKFEKAKVECDKWKQLFYDAKKVIGENAQQGNERRCGMKRVIGLAMVILFVVSLFAGLFTLMVLDGIKPKVAVFITLGSFATAVLLLGFIHLIAWLLD